MKKNIEISLVFLSALLPIVTEAAFSGVLGLLADIKLIIVQLIPVMFGIALIFFFWGMVQFISQAGNDKTREEGKKKMLWGVIALFVMLSIYGILYFIGDLIGIAPGGNLLQGLFSN